MYNLLSPSVETLVEEHLFGRCNLDDDCFTSDSEEKKGSPYFSSPSRSGG